MRTDTSPLQQLASYAIVLAVGALAPTVIKYYGKYQYRKGRRDGQRQGTAS